MAIVMAASLGFGAGLFYGVLLGAAGFAFIAWLVREIYNAGRSAEREGR